MENLGRGAKAVIRCEHDVGVAVAHSDDLGEQLVQLPEVLQALLPDMPLPGGWGITQAGRVQKPPA